MPIPSPRSLEQAFGGAILRVEYRSITTVEADVLVSSDDTVLSMSGGSSSALLDEGGESILLEAREQTPLPLGGVAVTGAGRLHARKIFHVAVLDYTERRVASIDLIRGVTRACLTECDRRGLTSICFPALATGAAFMSPERSAFAMLMEIAAYLGGPTRISAVTIALFHPFKVDSSVIIDRFFAQVTDFLELSRRLEGTASAVEAMEQAYRSLGSEGGTESASSFRRRLSEHRTRLEEALSSGEPGDAQRERGWLTPFEDLETDVLGMSLPPEPAIPAPATQAPPARALSVPFLERAEVVAAPLPPPQSAPGSLPSQAEYAPPPPSPQKAAPSEPRSLNEAQVEQKSSRKHYPAPAPAAAPIAAPAAAPAAAPVDWRAIELRCKDERRGMLRALVAIRERDLAQLELNAALGASPLDDAVMVKALERLDWLKQQIGQLDRDLDASFAPGARVVAAVLSPSGVAPRLHILHLSDLHFGTADNAQSWYEQLTADLTQELGCERLDGAVLSGDIANRSTRAEYAAAKAFLDKLCARFGLARSRLVIVPGNHDINWPLSEKAYTVKKSKDYKGPRSEDRIIDKGEYIEAREEAKYLRRMEPFRAFYESVKGEPYPAEHQAQATIHAFSEIGVVFLGLNSAWQLDHHYTKRAGIDARALSAALEQLDRHRALYRDYHKIAVMHHPLSSEYEDRIKDHGFMERLAVAGFRLTLHGHIHKARTLPFHYDHVAGGRKIDVIAAGTFGAPVHEWVPGHPLQYNLLRLEGRRLTVETRRREELEGAWKPDARWLQGAGRDPLPRYEIDL